MIIAVCPHCGHNQQIRATTVGAIKKCVACGQQFRPELRQARSSWRTVFGVAIVMTAFGVWYTHRPAPRNDTSTSTVDSRPAAITAPTPPVAVHPPPPPAAPGPSVSERRQAALAALHSRPDYIAAKKRADDLSEAVNAARADPEHASLPALSQDWINAKSELVRLEAEATKNLK